MILQNAKGCDKFTMSDLRYKVIGHLRKLHSDRKTRAMANDIFNYIVMQSGTSSLENWGKETYWDLSNYDKGFTLTDVLKRGNKL